MRKFVLATLLSACSSTPGVAVDQGMPAAEAREPGEPAAAPPAADPIDDAGTTPPKADARAPDPGDANAPVVDPEMVDAKPPPGDASCPGYTTYVVQPGHGIFLTGPVHSTDPAVSYLATNSADCGTATTISYVAGLQSGTGVDIPCGQPAVTFTYKAPSSAISFSTNFYPWTDKCH